MRQMYRHSILHLCFRKFSLYPFHDPFAKCSKRLVGSDVRHYRPAFWNTWRTGHERDTAKTFENIGGGWNADTFAACTLERPTLLSLAECSVFTLYRSAAAKKGNFPIQGSERPSRRWDGRVDD